MKKWIIVVLILVALVVMLVWGGLWYMQSRMLGISTGRCVVDASGNYLLIRDGSPICMGDRSNGKNLFADITTGDEIRVLHDGIMETWPGQTGAYYVKKLSDGTVADIPEDLIQDLSQMGWTPAEENGKTYEIYGGKVTACETDEQGNLIVHMEVMGESQSFTLTPESDVRTFGEIEPGDTVRLYCSRTLPEDERIVTELVESQRVKYAHGYASVSLQLSAGWNWEIVEYEEGCDWFGIHFWPLEHPGGKLRLEFYPRLFGVCGTDLHEEEIWLNGIRAIKGIYGSDPQWSFIAFRGTPGDYAVTRDGDTSNWGEYEQEAMRILNTVRLADGLLWEGGAINMTRDPESKYDEERAEFDYETGMWTVTFYRGGKVVKTSQIHATEYIG